MKLRDLGERKILEKIIFRYTESKLNELGKDEDAIALRINDTYLVINVDTFVKGTDAPPEMTELHIGYRVVTMTVSDLISKGALPEIILLSISAPPDLEITKLDSLLDGIRIACEKYNVKYLGGDFGESYDLILTGVGLGRTNKIIRRNTALPGDTVWVTGAFGNSGAALHYLLRGGNGERHLIDDILEKYFFSPLSLNDGKALREIASAAMDSSDGLAITLNTIASQSNVMIELHEIPISTAAKKYAIENNLDPLDLVFFGGEEFEIVFTVRGISDDEVISRFREYNAREPIKIGIVKKGEGVYFKGNKIPCRGWEHFSDKR